MACVRLRLARSPDGDGYITIDEARGVLSYTALELTLEEREQKLQDADTIKGDGLFTRVEFVDLCCATLWDRSVEELQVAASVRLRPASTAKTEFSLFTRQRPRTRTTTHSAQPSTLAASLMCRGGCCIPTWTLSGGVPRRTTPAAR
jgi:hypothetical protein